MTQVVVLLIARFLKLTQGKFQLLFLLPWKFFGKCINLELNYSEALLEEVNEQYEIDNSPVEPIQFQNQIDITDEDLQKYLEELEEEEDRGSDTEVKPVRPGFLHLNEGPEAEHAGSPGLTPLPKNGEEPGDEVSEQLG